MAALTASRNTPRVGDGLPRQSAYKIADNVKIYPGAMVMLSGGYAAPAVAGAGVVVVGRYAGSTVADNTGTGHAAGLFKVPVDHGDFWWGNKAGDLVAITDVGTACYIGDDQTVGITSTTNSAVGKVQDVDSVLGVLVRTIPL